MMLLSHQLAVQPPLHIGAFRASSYPPRNLRMHSRLIFPFIFGALIASVAFGQDKSQPTVDELVSKNIEAKGGATALHDLQSLRLTGKLLVQQGGEIELGYLEIKKRPDEVRTEASLQGMTQIQAYDAKERRTNKESLSIRSKRTCLWMTRNFISPAK